MQYCTIICITTHSSFESLELGTVFLVYPDAFFRISGSSSYVKVKEQKMEYMSVTKYMHLWGGGLMLKANLVNQLIVPS